MLDAITPVILTYNEQANIARTLGQLGWAREVVVVDGESNDGTREIVAGFPNARLLTHSTPHHADKWAFAIHESGIKSEWVLRLDADYFVPDAAVDELRKLTPAAEIAAYKAHIDYCIFGRPLRGSLYPPNTVLFRRDRVRLRRDGHTERWEVDGETSFLASHLQHDDRKSIWRWLDSQRSYLRWERDKLLASSEGPPRLADRIRRLRVAAPPLVLADLALRRGLLLDGRAGLFYMLQRVCAETILALYLLEADLGGEPRGLDEPEVHRNAQRKPAST